MSLSFLSKENPLIANIKKGKFLTPWFFGSVYSVLHHRVHVPC